MAFQEHELEKILNCNATLKSAIFLVSTGFLEINSFFYIPTRAPESFDVDFVVPNNFALLSAQFFIC